MNVGEAHCDNDCLFSTPMGTSQLSSLIRVALYICSMGYGLPWYGPFFNSIEMGGWFQTPRVPSKNNSYSSSSESSLSWCNGSMGEKLSLSMASKSALSYLASSISMTHLVALQVLTGSWARQVFCCSTLAMLDLSCRLAILLMGKRIQSMVMVFFLKSRTTPISCKVCLPMIKSYRGALAPALYYTISGVSWTELLAEYSTKEMSISATFLVWKVPVEVPHDCGTALFTVGMYLLNPFLIKWSLLLIPVSSSILIVLVVTIGLFLALIGGPLGPLRCFLDLSRSVCFKLAFFWLR